MPDQSYQGKLSMFPYDPRYTAIAPPTAGIFDEPQMSICFNVEWAAHIDGVLSRLLWTDAWAGTPATQQWAVAQITALLVSMIQRNPCGGGDCMGECCDDIVERLERIEALLAAGPVRSPDEIQEDVVQVQEAYETRITEIEAVYEDDITNVHPDMTYGDSSDPIRDQALCFMTRRFVDICCDWVIQNIKWKQSNQQTALNIASFIGNAADVAARLFAETAFGALFANIDQMLELEVSALSLWVTTVSEEQLAIFQDEDAREAVACGWYNELKGQTPSANLFYNSIDYPVLTGNADVIRDKLADALVPVTSPQQPDPEHIFFIWSDLWQEAYEGAQNGLVPDCLCEEPTEPRTPVINSLWDAPNIAGTLEGPDEDGFYTAYSTSRGTDTAFCLMDADERSFVLTDITLGSTPACEVFMLDTEMIFIGCPAVHVYEGQIIDEFWATWPAGVFSTMRFKMVAP